MLRTGEVWEGRWFALEALTYLYDHAKDAKDLEVALPAICDALRTDASSRVRFRAADALWHTDGPLVVQALLHALRHDADFEVRSYAAMILGEKQDQAAIPGLVEALSDPEPWVRYYAARSLARVPSKEALAGLEGHESDDVPWVIAMIRDAAQRLRNGPSAAVNQR